MYKGFQQDFQNKIPRFSPISQVKYIILIYQKFKTIDRQVYFAFINLFVCLCTKTTHSLSNLALFSQIIFARSFDLELEVHVT